MRRLPPALAIAMLLSPTLAAAQRYEAPARYAVPRTSPRADNQPLRPSLPARAPALTVAAPTPLVTALTDPRGPALGVSRSPPRPGGYVQDRTGAVCRTTCATQRYACMAGDDPDGCQAPWSRCVAAC